MKPISFLMLMTQYSVPYIRTCYMLNQKLATFTTKSNYYPVVPLTELSQYLETLDSKQNCMLTSGGGAGAVLEFWNKYYSIQKLKTECCIGWSPLAQCNRGHFETKYFCHYSEERLSSLVKPPKMDTLREGQPLIKDTQLAVPILKPPRRGHPHYNGHRGSTV